MSLFDRLPQRKDGTKITPWDDDWTNDPSGVYEPRWGREKVVVEKVWNFKDAEVTGEMVDPGLMLMFTKGGYKELFGRLYGGNL